MAVLTDPTPLEVRENEVEARIAELMGVINAATAELVRTLAEVLEEGLWEQWGIRSPEHWVTWRCGVSRSRARSLVASARRVRELPVTAATFRSGALTEDQVAVIARYTPPERDAEIAELAALCMVPQLRRALRTLPAPKSEPEPEPIREVCFGYRDDSRWWCRMELPADEGAVIQRAFEVGRDTVFRDRHPDPDADPCADRGDISWSDGAVRAAEVALAGFGAGIQGRPSNRTQMLVHVDLDSLGDRPAHLHLGPALPGAIRRMLGCDCTIRVVYEADHIPVGFGRIQRTVDDKTRALVEDRDRGCRVPGCDQARWLHVHHLSHWEDGGPTELWNLVALCSYHHRLHHQGRLDIRGDPNLPNGLVFTNPATGRELKPPLARAPNAPPADAARHLGLPAPHWAGPTGERFDYRWIGWN